MERKFFTLVLAMLCLFQTGLSQRKSEREEENLLRIIASKQNESNNAFTSFRLLDSLKKAQKNLDQFKRSNVYSAMLSAPQFKWQVVPGFENIAGRSRTAIFDLHDKNNRRVYAGTGSGLFVNDDITNDCSPWRPLTDAIGSPVVTCIAQDLIKPKTIYIGTGDGYWGDGLFRGDGIFVSNDAGNTWQQMPSTANNKDWYYVQKILIISASEMYAATNTGLKHTLNAGQTWTPVNPGFPPQENVRFCNDILIGADQTIYVTYGNRDEAGSIWKLSGSMWRNITPAGNFHRIMLGLNHTDKSTLYALAQEDDRVSVYCSPDQANKWFQLQSPPFENQFDFSGGYGWHNMSIAVHPVYSSVVYIGGVVSYNSFDAGGSWFPVGSNMHFDHHSITIHPNGNAAIWATDGGVYYTHYCLSSDPELYSRNVGLNTTQFYSCNYAKTAGGSLIIGGTQDNGLYRIEFPQMSTAARVSTGDYGSCFFSSESTDVIASTSADGAIYKLSENGDWDSVQLHSTRLLEVADYDTKSGKIYVSGHDDTIFIIENFFTKQRAVKTISLNDPNDWVTAIKLSPNSALVYVGTRNGNLYKLTFAAGQYSLNKIQGPSFKHGEISSIDIYENGTAADTYFLATSTGIDSDTRVFFTSQLNATNPVFKNLTTNNSLPNVPVRWGIFDPGSPNTIHIATEVGVWSTTLLQNAPENFWNLNNTGLPYIRVDMLRVNKQDKKLLAATHGRGIYITSLP